MKMRDIINLLVEQPPSDLPPTLCEARRPEGDALLYHATGISAAINILQDGFFVVGENRPEGISTTSDPKLRYYNSDFDEHGFAPVQFELDQQRIRQQHKAKRIRQNPNLPNENEVLIQTERLPISFVNKIILMPVASDFRDRANDDDLWYVGQRGIKATAYREIIGLARAKGIEIEDRRRG